MPGEKFTLMQYSVNAILGLIEANDFVIPEIQRPFVWKRSQVRDLIDSLYHGYPTGYIITWKNPSVRTKDGGYSQGKKVLIDGQQRITALMAAISGKEVLDEDFKKDRIKIAFNPLAADDSKRFAVQDASHLKDKKWIPDISVLFSANFKPRAFENEYAKNNPNVDLDELAEEISKLTGIANRQIGVIELDHSLDIDEVTEIFIRINSKGTALSQSDFVMSKMAADTDHDGSIMRKAVDYFCHLAVKPEFYENLKKDTEFQQSIFADKIKWLAKDYDDIYDPGYSDMLRVSFMHQFRRGKLADLVSLLSGRDFETKEFREDIVSDSYQKLEHGILNFINEYNFTQYIDKLKGLTEQQSEQVFGIIAQRIMEKGNFENKPDGIDGLRILVQQKNSLRRQLADFILHWFTGTPVQMEDAINLGCFFSINPKMLKTKSGINLIHKIPPNRILIETDAPFSGEFKNAKQLKNILQDMIDNISMIKGIDLKKYLIHNEETVFAY